MYSPGIPETPISPISGFATAPPPPPPPPPPPMVPGQVPALRINTALEPGPRRGPQPALDPYEPPAAIQNAMMTKDKKPFTYTPGMGGKLDLSQIRSPRMARRVAKNAEDEGIEGPPKVLGNNSAATTPQTPGAQPTFYSQPQVAVPVFPQNVPQQNVSLRNSTLPYNPTERQSEPSPRPVIRVETRAQPAFNTAENQSPTPPTSPTQVTLAKAPTPWMQKPLKQQEELPEWAKRTNANRQDSMYEPESPQVQQQQSPQPRQIIVVNTPKQQPQSQQQQFIPQQQMRPVRQDSERVAVPRIEDRPSIFSALNEGGHHQLSNTTPHHQSRWGNPVGQSAAPVQQNQGGSYIIPVQVDSQQYNHNSVQSPTSVIQNPMQYRTVPDSPTNRNGQRNNVPAYQQPEPGPVQSKSFRVLQKITDTDADQVDGEQLRKLQLTEDDRHLMDKFREQVDGDTYLHKEEDPRYRGAAIPSRAFRFLQNMTDSGDGTNQNSTASRPVNYAPKKPNRNPNTFEEEPAHVYVPASQQQVQEPKKYTGGAIPSRSFRILQAMTTPENIGSHGTNNSCTSSANCVIPVLGPSNKFPRHQKANSLSTHSLATADSPLNGIGNDSTPRILNSSINHDKNSSVNLVDSFSQLALHSKNLIGLVPSEEKNKAVEAGDAISVDRDFDEGYSNLVHSQNGKDTNACLKELDVENHSDPFNIGGINTKASTSLVVGVPELTEFASVSKEQDRSSNMVANQVVVESDIHYQNDTNPRVPSPEITQSITAPRNDTPKSSVSIEKNASKKRFEYDRLFEEKSSQEWEISRMSKTLSKEEVSADEQDQITFNLESKPPKTSFDDKTMQLTTPQENLASKRTCKKYQRVQTHSRLLRLLSDEPKQQANSSHNKNKFVTFPTLNLQPVNYEPEPTPQKDSYQPQEHNESHDGYYPKENEDNQESISKVIHSRWIRSRNNVCCPRIRAPINSLSQYIPGHQERN